ncbi:MAG: glucosyl hydrolase family protein [Herbinix sp.]|jgi:rhamnogalacturonyl hydrolase YesR|nr:glucosyl hydrolase family protein [Herbinix sp.]
MFHIDYQILSKVKSALLCIQRFQWEQGCTAQAILEFDGLTEEVIRLCEATVLRSAPDGRLGVMEQNESVTDPAAVGEALILAAEKTQRDRYKDAADKLYQYLKYNAPRTQDGILYHFDGKNLAYQIWVDSNYMAPPFLCKYGDVEEAMKQIKGFRKYLYHEDRKLLSHIWDDKKSNFGRIDFWGVGNGWTLAGLSRIIAMLEGNYQEEKAYLIYYLKDLLDGCIKYQRDDGLFHNILDDPSSFVETNVGQMIAYTIYRGVAAGYVDSDYLAVADKARQAAYSKVDEDGFVREVCGMPYFSDPGVAPEGQAFFILMEAAARDYYEK